MCPGCRKSRNDVAKANGNPSLRQNTRYHTHALGNEAREGPRRGGDFKDTEILSLNARFELSTGDDKGNVDIVGGTEIQFIVEAPLSRLQVQIAMSLNSDKLFWARHDAAAGRQRGSGVV